MCRWKYTFLSALYQPNFQFSVQSLGQSLTVIFDGWNIQLVKQGGLTVTVSFSDGHKMPEDLKVLLKLKGDVGRSLRTVQIQSLGYYLLGYWGKFTLTKNCFIGYCTCTEVGTVKIQPIAVYCIFFVHVLCYIGLTKYQCQLKRTECLLASVEVQHSLKSCSWNVKITCSYPKAMV